MNRNGFQIINGIEFDDVALSEAQFDINHHPSNSSFWDSARGQESAKTALGANLKPTTTETWRRNWHNCEMNAAREEHR